MTTATAFQNSATSTSATRSTATETTASDVGLLALRVGFGGLLAVHGAQKLFGWFGGYGLQATQDGFEAMGYNPGVLFGTLAGVSELVGGLLLLLGLFTPLAAAIALGTMVNALNATWSGGFVAWEMAALFGIASVALAFTGPGRFSLDAGKPWQRQGLVWAGAAVALAVGAGVLTLILKWVL
ncbi:DoxX family protein [Nocardia sp. 2]|uniref:DoxX family protein n=1 Tax=Nocardia acididurans TaxID=2802282 RepID=A0ABS1MBT9_9NOCA|nr:DoxX family protein [Nocardia acididurans]MBL1078108.1 DoxX family protein [Nocardia acididurans]